ncbi:MAG: hypothetical protein ABIP55_12880 [Tepidisphaeraceae bacterium]
MGRPSKLQVADAIIYSARNGENDAEFDERFAGLSRQSDEELAAMGIPPPDPACPEPVEGPDPDPLAFEPATLKARHDGWTAGRQRAFIAALAETGCVSEACAEVGITPRSAYRLREHAAAAGFRAAWGHAESMATARLTALAFERAVHGSVERIYRDGVLVEERRKPSDKLLMWLLSHRDPVGFGWLERPPREAPDASFYPLQSARSEMPHLLEQLSDIDPAACPAEPVAGSDVDYDAPSPRA